MCVVDGMRRSSKSSMWQATAHCASSGKTAAMPRIGSSWAASPTATVSRSARSASGQGRGDARLVVLLDAHESVPVLLRPSSVRIC